MIRILSFLVLALVLALTSQSMAVARGSAAATGQMVLCTGTGPLVVYMDAQGRPTSAPHICPDAALNVLVDVAAPAWIAPQRIARFETDAVLKERPILRLPRPAPQSRAPPLNV